MSAVLGIDLSSFAIDLVKLDENTSRAEWVRVELSGATAWERLLDLPDALRCATPVLWLDDVYLVAVEAPHGRGEAGTQAKLNHVAGAIAAALPQHLRWPNRCWLVAPHEWKNGLQLKAKPTSDEIARLAPGAQITALTPTAVPATVHHPDWQNVRDAYCLALWARDMNAAALTSADRKEKAS